MVQQQVDATLIREVDLDDVARPAGEDLAKRATVTTIRGTMLYNTRTFEPISFPRSMVLEALKKKHTDSTRPEWVGKRLLTRGIFNEVGKTYSPPGEYKLGTTKCFLHPGLPERAEFDLMGYPVCLAEHLASTEEAKLHAERRHKSTWAREKERRADREREEDRDLVRQQIAAMSGLAQRAVNGQQVTAVTERTEEQRRVARERMAKARSARKVKPQNQE